MILLVYNRKFLDTATKNYSGGISDIHLGIRYDKFSGHGLFYCFIRFYKKQVTGSNIPDNFIAVKNREAVMFGLLDLFNYRLDSPMQIHTDDIIGHIVLDLFFIHLYIFRLP